MEARDREPLRNTSSLMGLDSKYGCPGKDVHRPGKDVHRSHPTSSPLATSSLNACASSCLSAGTESLYVM